MTIQTSERHVHERIGSALYRLAELGQRADAAGESPKASGKLVIEVRKLAADLERILSDMQQIASRYLELQDQATAACRRGERIFELSPTPCLLLDHADASVADANPAAVRLLNVSHRHLVGRSFLLFLNGDRNEFLERFKRLDGEAESATMVLRPRERSAVNTTLVAWRDGVDRVFVMIVPAGVANIGSTDAEPLNDSATV